MVTSSDAPTIGYVKSRRCPVCGAKYPSDFLVCPKDATSLEPDNTEEDPLIGDVLAGTFRITQLLGSGGMGRVYEADHVRLPRKLAVKVMHETLSRHPEAVARFEREAQAAARIASEHVVEVVDVVRTRDGLPSLVAELLEGEDLSSLCERMGKLPVNTAITICRQMCRGLAAAHEVGVVHRDLKPSNVFLVRRPDERIQIKLLDFGVAKVMDDKNLTRTGVVVGTPAYMAPEQARGSAAVDQRSDVYAVGAVLYRLLTGSAPFPDDDPATVINRVLTEDPKRPRELERGIPEGVELLIQRAMARSPKDRPATAMELDRELAAFDERAKIRAPTLAVQARSGSGYVGHIKTMALGRSAPPPAPANVESMRRASRARPAAFGLAFTVGAVAGASVFVITAPIVLLVAGRQELTDMETILLGVISGFCLLFATIGSLRALVSRWRSAWAVQRLAGGLKMALVGLLCTTGMLSIAWRTYRFVGRQVAAVWLPVIDIALVAVPTLLGAMVFVYTLKRAKSHS
jgi:serine/threonine protein kinase